MILYYCKADHRNASNFILQYTKYLNKQICARQLHYYYSLIKAIKCKYLFHYTVLEI